MDYLPDALLQYIISGMTNARDIAMSNCVSKRWKESTEYVKTIYFPRNCFDNISGSEEDPDAIVLKMILSFACLEGLVVYSSFTSRGLESWLMHVGSSLRHLELRMDNLASCQAMEGSSKLDCIGVAKNLEILKLWGVFMINPPKWDMFPSLHCLEIVGARVEDAVLTNALCACPNLRKLLLLGCEGVKSISIEFPYLEQCKLDFYGSGSSSLSLTSPRLESLDVQGCSWIRVPETRSLKNLSISNSAGRVYMVDFGRLSALEVLSIRGVQWCWDAICKMLEQAREVKHLYMKVEFTGDYEAFQPFPEVDFVEFFNNHPNLRKFDIHGAMFAALCQKNSLKTIETGFTIPCLEEVVITVRSPLNAEQKMITLESLVKYAKSLRVMVIRILQMKSNHSSADDFFDEICRFKCINRNIVRIE